MIPLTSEQIEAAAVGSAVMYYECHITIDPAGERHEEFRQVCKRYAFRVADLLMRKSLEPSQIDSFCTGRHDSRKELEERMHNLVGALIRNDFVVRRYKIEAAVLDVRISDRSEP